MSEGNAYHFAFRVGFVGAVLLTLLALLGDTVVAMIALAVWSPITVFLIPWLYVVYCKKEPAVVYKVLRVVKQ